MKVRLISIVGRWDQPIYPPPPPPIRIADLFPERSPLRPQARALLHALMKKENRYAPS